MKKIDLTQHVVRWAREGHTDMAILLCRGASAELRKNKKLHPVVSEYFARALERIAAGEDPKKALHLNAPAKRPNEFNRNREIAIDYQSLLGDRKTPKAAKLDVGKSWGLDPKRVERIVNSFNKDFIKSEIVFRKRLKTTNEKALKLIEKERNALRRKKHK